MTGRPPAPADPVRVARGLAAANIVLFTVMRFAQWVSWGGVEALWADGVSRRDAIVGITMVLLGNTVVGLLLVLLVFVPRPERRGWPARIALAVTAGAVGGVLRLLTMRSIPAPDGPLDDLVDWLATVAALTVAVASALVVHDLVRRYQREERRRSEQELSAARTVARLEAEEAVRRRIIADQLHGTVQNRLAVVTAGLDRASADLDAERHPLAPVLHELSEDLDEVREQDVRSLSHELFPTAADVSTTRAVGVVLDRLPPSIYGDLVVGPAYRAAERAHGDPLPLADRIVVVDTVEEALTNALKHGHAVRVTVTIDLRTDGPDGRTRVVGEVVSDGAAPPAVPALHGLDRHRARLEARGGHVALGPGPDGAGARLVLDVPVPVVQVDVPDGAGG
jgi:signal transduction histidine kinase